MSHYVDVLKIFQKIKLFCWNFFHEKKTLERFSQIEFASIISTLKKLVSFQILQFFLSRFTYLIYHNVKRQIYINLNINKKFNLDVMIYHIKKNFRNENYSSRFVIKFILFLSRFLSSIETKYWSIELKLVDIVWVLKKIKHLIKSSFFSIVVYTNHDIVLKLTK